MLGGGNVRMALYQPLGSSTAWLEGVILDGSWQTFLWGLMGIQRNFTNVWRCSRTRFSVVNMGERIHPQGSKTNPDMKSLDGVRCLLDHFWSR